MAVTFKKGNAVSALIDGEIDVLLHVCNNKGVMGSGIALEIKNRIPDAYTWFSYYHQHGISSLGHISSDAILRSCRSKKVFNMVAQDGYGQGIRHLNYGALADCLRQVAENCSHTKDLIGIPFKMGADRAGGDWNIVLELVEYFLKDFNVIVYQLEG